MKKTVVALMILLFAAVAVGQPVPEGENLEEVKEAYNNQSSKVPGFVGNIVGGETVNINLKSNQSSETIGAEFKGVEIENISESRYEDYTLEVNVTDTAIKTVVESEQPFKELRNQLQSENIEYETRSVSAGIKVKIFETLNSLASMIGL